MDYKIFVFFVLTSHITAFHRYDENIGDEFNSFEDEYENTLPDEYTRTVPQVTKRPITSYEVTEIIDDIPDDRTIGPIVANHTLKRPLNLAPSTNPLTSTVSRATTTEKNKNNKENTDGTYDKDEGKKNYINIFHIKAEIDDKDNKNQITTENNVPYVPGIKEYLNNLKKGIVSGFNSIINKHKNRDEDFVFDSHPFSFFDKFHKPSIDLADKFHSAFFGKDDDIFSH